MNDSTHADPGAAAALFEGFEAHDVPTTRGTVHAPVGGSGPRCCSCTAIRRPHLMWHAAAPRLAEQSTVVAADLPGYGGSSGRRRRPTTRRTPSARWPSTWSQAMAALGFERFAVAGPRPRRPRRLPDGARPSRPVSAARGARRRADRRGVGACRRGARARLLALVVPRPARAAARAPDRRRPAARSSTSTSAPARARPRGPGRYPEEVMAAYRRLLDDPSVVEAICEDYRAGAGDRPRARRRRPRPPAHRMPAAGAVERARRAASSLRRRARRLAPVGARADRPRPGRHPLPRRGPPRRGRGRAAPPC